jgi:hypothetical protein
MSLASDLHSEHGEPNDVDPEEAFSGGGKGPYLPPGQWRVGIKPDYSDYKDTRSGKMVKLDLKVLTDQQADRRLFPIFNVINKNQDVAQRARDQLHAVWIACGGDPHTYPELTDFYGETFVAVTGLQWDDYKGGDYQAVLWGAKPESEDPIIGRYPDESMPDIWEEAVEYARQQDDDGGDGGGNSGRGPSGGGGYSEDSFDDDEIPF